MGNRAVITTGPYSDNNVGIYLHWNGGRASIEGFLKACETLGYLAPPDPYGLARLTQAIGTYFEGGLSVGIDLNKNLDCDNGDNGTYLITGWKIAGRHCGLEMSNEEIDQAKTDEICQTIVERLRQLEEA